MGTTYQIDFADVKAGVTWEQVLSYLNIPVRLIAASGKLRGKCPFCKHPKDEFSVTKDAGKDGDGLFGCWICKANGDKLELVSLMRGKGPKSRDGWKAAATELYEQFLNSTNSSTTRTVQNSPPQSARSGFSTEAFAKGLDPDHVALNKLGLSPETLRQWQAGFCSSGKLQGRLAIPVTRAGQIVHWIGRTLKDDTPLLTFPNGVVPTEYIVGEEWVKEGKSLTLVRDPLDALLAYDRGEPNVISLLTECLAADQLEYLSALMNRKQCPSLDYY